MTSTDTGTDARTVAADQRTARLAQTMDSGTLAAVVAAVGSAVNRRIGGHVAETETEAVALADSLAEVAARPGTVTAADVARIVAGNVADAVRDTLARHANDALCLSLDASLNADDPNGVTLAETVAVSALLSQSADDTSGGYRGVARVPHPTDILRPLSLPTPHETASAALDSLTEEARRLLRVTVAVNVAAVEQARQHADALAAVAADITADRDRAKREPWRAARLAAVRATLKDAQAALKEARRAAREVTPQQRTPAVAAVLGVSGRGRAGMTLGAQQKANAAAFIQQTDAIRRAAVEAFTDRLDSLADAQRAAYRSHGGTDGLPHVATMTTYQAIHSARRARRDAALSACQPMPGTLAAAAQRSPSTGRTDADTDTPRPRRALHGWDAWHALPGSAKGMRADVLARPCPTASRTADDDTAPRAPRGTAHLFPSPLPGSNIPGPSAPTVAGAPTGYTVTPADLAAFAHRRAVARVLAALGWPAAQAYDPHAYGASR